MAKDVWGRQEGWNSGTRNFAAQRRIDEKRSRRKEKYARQGRKKFGSRKARYRGRQI